MSQHAHAKATPIATTAPTIAQSVNTSTAADASSAEPAEQQKIPKPSAAEVTNKVLAVLMVSEPQTIADLCKQMPDLPRDSIQAVLEVLQVLGLVVQLSTTKEAVTAKSNSSNSQTFVYALAEFAKFNTAFPLTQIEPEIKNMQTRTKDVRARIQELQVGSIRSFCSLSWFCCLFLVCIDITCDFSQQSCVALNIL